MATMESRRHVSGGRVAGSGAYGIRAGDGAGGRDGQTALEFLLDLPQDAADSDVCNTIHR